MLKINIITLFPEFFDSPLKAGILGRAIESQLLKVCFTNPRTFTDDLYQSVDDSPFGGGDGMVLKYEPLKRSIEFINNNNTKKINKVIYLSPQGKKWDYKQARYLGHQTGEWIFICGRYGGIDQRVIAEYVDEEISIGDYIITGGEPAMLVLLDSISRFIKGALGRASSFMEDSFENHGLLEAPQWTRPQVIKDYEVPKTLLSGHHKKIKKFNYLLSIFITALKRPDLLLNNNKKKDLLESINMVESFSSKELKSCGIPPDFLEIIKKNKLI